MDTDKIYELNDNVDDSANVVSNTTTTSAGSTAISAEWVDNSKKIMKLNEISTEVAKYYRKEINMNFIFPLQCTDGSVLEIVDADKSLIATARIRFSANEIKVDKTNFDTSISLYFSDLTFQRKQLNVKAAAPRHT